MSAAHGASWIAAGSGAALVLEHYHSVIAPVAVLLELCGAFILVAGVCVATAVFLLEGVRQRSWLKAYTGYRANLGRGILLGLEFLVGADILTTITAPLTFQAVGLLGLVVLIRTFLSFALETEIQGRWPWRRDAGASGSR